MINKTFGRLYILIIVFGLLFCSACINEENSVEEEFMDMNDPIKYLALGDSYTIGQGVEETKRWPVQIGEELKGNNFEVQMVDIIAQTGWTTSDLINGIENTELEDYNLVSLLIGVNNQFQNLPFEIFESEFNLLLNQLFNFVSRQDVEVPVQMQL